jgi:hypothetical protein
MFVSMLLKILKEVIVVLEVLQTFSHSSLHLFVRLFAALSLFWTLLTPVVISLLVLEFMSVSRVSKDESVVLVP